MIAGGGTGGHVYPGVAIARELLARSPEREVLFVGTSQGLESRLVPAEGFRLETIRATGLAGMGVASRLAGLARLPLGLLDSHRILGRFRPSLVVGVGGYASGPVLAAAVARRAPTMIHEQNRWPGITNRILAPLVDRVAVSFPGTAGGVGRRGVVTGNPVRPAFRSIPPMRDGSGTPRVLIFGGSRGARALNEAVMEALPLLAALGMPVELHHQTGPADLSRVQDAYRASGYTASTVEAFIDPMADALAAADLVIARAGASTLAELAVAGRPSVLVPFPNATHDHQRHNAGAFADAGASVVIDQRELSGERLAAVIGELSGDPGRLRSMADGARTLAHPDAAERIADLAESLLERAS